MTSDIHERIEGRRIRIDELDSQLIELLQARTETSHSIQQDRMENGGQRTDLSREAAVIARYQEAFPEDGASIALKVLELCRSRHPHPSLEHIRKESSTAETA